MASMIRKLRRTATFGPIRLAAVPKYALELPEITFGSRIGYNLAKARVNFKVLILENVLEDSFVFSITINITINQPYKFKG